MGRRHFIVLVLLLLGCAAIALFRIWEAVENPAGVWQDSVDYHAVSQHGWLTAQLWWGARAPGVPVLLKLSGSYRTFGIVQAILAALAWSALSITVARLVRWDWRAVLMGWAVLAFATAPLVVQWDWSVLSESLSLSAAAMACAAALWVIWRFTWPRFVVLTLSVAAYVELRDADIWEVMVVAAALVGVGIYRTMEGAGLSSMGIVAALRNRWEETRRWTLVGLSLLGITVFAEAGALHAHRNVINVEHALFVRVFPFPDRVAWFAAHGMPDAALVEQQARSTPRPPKKIDAKVVGIDLNDPSFGALHSWFEHDAGSTYIFFLVTHPGYDLTAPFASPRLTYDDAEGQLSFYASQVTHPLNVVEDVLIPNRFVVIGLALAALVLGVWRGIYKRPEWKFFAILVAAGLVSMLLSWHGDGEEVTRHMVEGDVLVRFAVLVLFMFGCIGSAESPIANLAAESKETDQLPSMPLLETHGRRSLLTWGAGSEERDLSAANGAVPPGGRDV
ncbi:MAG TPA: hypothetical protein VEI83_10985 [Acidimicrobiales bacterium]|nr:hypothetical protein [Acidimicrobiales bacterium]